MMISTRGRYALRVLVDLAEHGGGQRSIPMRDVAQRQQISLKYLEQILPSLAKSGMIAGTHGKGGGYRLTKEPKDYRVGDILRLTEGDLAPVSCLECDAKECQRAEDCRTRPMWEKLDSLINGYLDSVTIEDLMFNQTGKGI